MCGGFDLFQFVIFNTLCIGDIMTGSFKGKRNLYIIVGQDSALTVNRQALVKGL